MKRTPRQRIDRLYEDQLEPWREAWSAFWEAAWDPLSDHELDLILAEPQEAPLDRAEARLLEGCPGLAAFDLGEPWDRWREAIDEVLEEARPGRTLPMDAEASVAELRRVALAIWPRSLPAPPEEPGGLWECLKRVTGAMESEGAITAEGCVAALALSYLALARAVRAVCRGR